MTESDFLRRARSVTYTLFEKTTTTTTTTATLPSSHGYKNGNELLIMSSTFGQQH
jgi:hypothetical protein